MKLRLILTLLLFGNLALAADLCKFTPVAGPHATLVVYRYRIFVGSGRRASIYLDDQKVCSLRNGRYLIIEVTPGKHALRSSDDKHGGVEQDFLSNQVLFYRVHAEATGAFQFKNFWVLEPSAENRARDDLRKLRAEEGETKTLPTL
ncbi:MAG: hypothetical protein ACRD2U_07350 [Terriglobales bacterium]